MQSAPTGAHTLIPDIPDPEIVDQADPAQAVPHRDVDVSQMVLPAMHAPLDVRSSALAILAALASVYALSRAQAFVVPLLLGVVVTYTLNPLVVWLEAIRIPRAVGTIIVMLSLIGAIALGTYSLRGELQTIIEQLPAAASKFATGLQRMQFSQVDNLQKIQHAAIAMEKATSQAPGASAAPRQPATHVIVDQPEFRVGNFLWNSSIGALEITGQVMMVAFLVFFLLLGGDTFRRKLVRLTGPSLARRKITVRILDDINSSIQKYMLMMLTTNLLVASLSWAAFRWIGLENAGAWAAVAGVLHIVPYLGPAIMAAAAAMAAFMQFESFAMVLLVAGASLGIATIVGTFVSTWMTGRIASMSPAAVFISLLFWGWLWGIWGLLLSIPIIVIIKVVSQHLEQLHPVSELLGD
jgi:predicted PurR-regulated permease PerM